MIYRCPYCGEYLSDDDMSRDGEALQCLDCGNRVEFFDALDATERQQQVTQLICNRANECGQKCAHSDPHARLWGRGVVSRVDYCASHHCLWWTRKDGRRREKVQCEEVVDDSDATQAG